MPAMQGQAYQQIDCPMPIIVKPATTIRNGLSLPLGIATPNKVGTRKPSPQFIEYILARTGIRRSEMVFLGDDNKTDLFAQ